MQTATGKYKGLKAGDPKFVDLDGNGRIDDGEKTANNRGDMRVIRQLPPPLQLQRKHQPRLERVRYFGLLSRCRSSAPLPRRQRHAPSGGGYARPDSSFVPEHFLDDVWSEDNPDAYFPKLRGYAAQGDRHLAKVNNRYLQNTAYCRLKNLTVGYTLPVDLTRKARIDRVRVYFSGDNLVTWTALKSKYIDPEQFSTDGSARVYPFAKTFSFGLDITF